MTMDYEKEYNEALERAKEILKHTTIEAAIAIKKILPSLDVSEEEDEDERIRKQLIQGMKNLEKTGRVYFYNASIKDSIAYLEKQQEQKPAEWSKNDTVFLKEITDFFENKTVKLQHDIDMYAHWLKSLPERFNLKPMNEWSEEDEKRVKQLIYDTEAIRAGYEKRKELLGERFNNELLKDCDEQIAWLKSLKNRGNSPKGNANSPIWKPTEDEERLINTSISFLKDFADKGYENAVECIDWLKSKLNGNTGK